MTCSLCGNETARNPCPICADPRRDRTRLCVVQAPRDVVVWETTHGYRGYRGLYYVLGGALAPLEGLTPDKLRLGALLDRVRAGGIRHVIMATRADLSGEATALYLARHLQALGVSVERGSWGRPG